MMRALSRAAQAIITALALAATSLPALAAEPSRVVTHSAPGKFTDVVDDLKLAVEARGLVIDHVSFVGRMLERTGKDVGSTRPLYQDAQALSFCSATLSRRTMEADAANLVWCPYTLVVYATAQDPTRVHVAFQRPWRPDGSAASRAALQEVEALLDGIARTALGLK